jgi:hypothetical protein
MTCPNCARAELRADWPGYTANCKPCMARGIAHGPDFWKSGKDGKLTPSYMAGLRSIWGEDWKSGHEQVKAAAERLRQARGTVL